MKLFEIVKEIAACVKREDSDDYVNVESGEIIDTEALDALKLERDVKIENIGKWILNLEADEKALAEQEKRFKERKDAAKRKKESLKNYLAFILDGKPYKCTACEMKFRASEAVVFSGDLSTVPKEYLRYKEPEIEQIIKRTSKILGTEIKPEALELLASRSRLTPRIANRLFRRVRDYADVNGDGIVDVKVAENALDLMEIDQLGLDPADRNMLRLMLENYGEKPVGLATIAALTGDEASTIEDFYEPYLMQMGLLTRTPKGRVVTEKGRKHLQKA